MTKATLIKENISLEACIQFQRFSLLVSWQGAWWREGRHWGSSRELHPDLEAEGEGEGERRQERYAGLV